MILTPLNFFLNILFSPIVTEELLSGGQVLVGDDGADLSEARMFHHCEPRVGLLAVVDQVAEGGVVVIQLTELLRDVQDLLRRGPVVVHSTKRKENKITIQVIFCQVY